MWPLDSFASRSAAVGHAARILRALTLPALIAVAMPGALAQSQPGGSTGTSGVVLPERSTLPAANQRAREESRRLSARVWRADGSEVARVDPVPGLSNDAQLVDLGRQLYLEGRRPDGRQLEGVRLDGQLRLAGPAAACALCHRRSGLGAVEGSSQVAPITGRYLFDQDRRAVAYLSLRARKAFSARHEPYDLVTLARALRSGVHVSGRDMDPLMPRYALDDRDVLALASYLRGLSNAWSEGVSDHEVQIATIVTPDVDPQRRQVFLDTLRGIVAQKNGNFVHGQRSMSSGAEMVLQTDRLWTLQVWELSGPVETWQAQLERLYEQQPVFAVTSGLGAGNWTPVHRFCESRRLPCWFPSVAAVPPESETGRYGMYFSRGVGLEADVLAHRLSQSAPAKGAAARVLQVHADDGVAEAAVAPLNEQLARTTWTASSLRWKSGDAGLRSALAGLQAGDALVLWLGPQDLRALGGLTLPAGVSVYVSASLGGGERPELPPAWRDRTLVVTPYQLPERRARGLVYFHEGLRAIGVPLTDELLQSEVYFALSYFNDTLIDMLDNVHRDYLVERGENMLSLREAAKAEDEARELSLTRDHAVPGNARPMRQSVLRPLVPRKPAGLARPMPAVEAADAAALDPAKDAGMADTGAAPEGTTVYPRLSLGPAQRHASKGAYIVRWADAADPVADWYVP